MLTGILQLLERALRRGGSTLHRDAITTTTRSARGSIGQNDWMPEVDYFTPHRIESPARARGCLTCAHFLGRFYADHVLCERDGGRYVVGVPAMGCAFWMREPGADDE